MASGQLPAGVDQEFAGALWAAQLVADSKLAAVFPGTEHIRDTQSSYYIQDENPQLVIEFDSRGGRHCAREPED